MADPFTGYNNSLSGPASGGFAITPNDSTDLATSTRAIMVGVAGDVAVTMIDGDDVTLPALTAGVIYPFRIARVKATGTTATGIIGLY